MRYAALLLILSPLWLATEANARACSIPSFSFNFTSQGPWRAHMRVQSGKSCGSRNWNTSGTFKKLYLASNAQHGKVVLSFPGGYRYYPAAGYVGDDGFTLKICGATTSGVEGCADLLFSVSVVPGGV